MLFFSAVLFLAEWWFKSDALFFAAFSNIFGNITGALIMKLKVGDHPPPGSTTDITTRQVTQTPPDAPPITELPKIIETGGFGVTGESK